MNSDEMGFFFLFFLSFKSKFYDHLIEIQRKLNKNITKNQFCKIKKKNMTFIILTLKINYHILQLNQMGLNIFVIELIGRMLTLKKKNKMKDEKKTKLERLFMHAI